MKINIKKTAATLAIMALVLAPVLAGAQTRAPGPPQADPPGSVDDLLDLLRTILGWVEAIFWIVAVIFVLWAAFLYLTAGGDDDKIKKASSQFLYAVIAIVVAIFARVLPDFVGSFLSGQ